MNFTFTFTLLLSYRHATIVYLSHSLISIFIKQYKLCHRLKIPSSAPISSLKVTDCPLYNSTQTASLYRLSFAYCKSLEPFIVSDLSSRIAHHRRRSQTRRRVLYPRADQLKTFQQNLTNLRCYTELAGAIFCVTHMGATHVNFCLCPYRESVQGEWSYSSTRF